ncbi:hypothetical protein [Polaromonas sp. JS666]|uniref:hypothetical protein n=1 Tax=Polaromonas sp. (strain JS666 / ATCC BAA-500) TaxID=296591 RepID=UPI0012EE8D33|nr:hypothetical protein [Polaromonas sp. JS666]
MSWPKLNPCNPNAVHGSQGWWMGQHERCTWGKSGSAPTSLAARTSKNMPDILLSVIRLHSRQVDPVRRRRKISKNHAKTYADGVSVIDEILGADGNGHQPHNPNSMIKIKHLQRKSIENQWK